MEKSERRSFLREALNIRVGFAALLGAILIVGSTYIESNPGLKTLTKEVGFALLVAVFVWILFEYFSQQRTEREIEQRIERITRSVFFGVFRRDLPKELIDETSLLVLEAKIVRKKFDVTYTLSDGSYETSDGRTKSYVLLRAVSHFTLSNISNEEVVVPIRVGLPNPIAPELRPYCRINSVAVIGRTEADVDRLDITDAQNAIQEDLKNPDKVLITATIGERRLAPGQDIRLAFDYVMPKEDEDSEILQSFYPSDGLNLKIIDRSPAKRYVRARAIHRTALIDNSSAAEPGLRVYTLDFQMLPHQGVVVWWKAQPAIAPTAS